MKKFIDFYFLEKTKVFFSLLFLFGLTIKGLSFIKYSGLYLSIFFFLLQTFIYKKQVINEIINSIKLSKDLIILLIFFIISILISSMFSYSKTYISLYEAFKYLVNILIFGLILLSISDKLNFIKKVFIIFMISLFYNLIFFSYETFDEIINLKKFKRTFTNYLEILFPFLLSYLLFFKKNRFLNILLSFTILILFIALLLTGARGSWGAIFVEVLIVLFYYIYTKKIQIRKILLTISTFLTITIIIGYGLYNTSNLFKRKFNQGIFYSSGRDKIILTRLPLFINSDRIWFGLGYSNDEYQKFLKDKNAPQIVGKKTKNNFLYFHDEPFIIQILYHFGILGTFIFIIMIFYVIYLNFYIIKNTKNFFLKIFSISILSSFTGYFLIRGLFENRSIKYFIIFIFLIILLQILFKKEKFENSIHLS